ncbi:sugar transferase [Burkholderia guangdongensis]|uniref:sugar transferase n=1 Tax=Burkholderia guangdongensis TaxID=1792500 RepID=UPI001C539572|nr:sugar transferase [Burkholderia guangdongensis]
MRIAIELGFVRIVDIALVVSGAFLPIRFGAGGAQGTIAVDGMLVAFAATFAMSVFPACKLYTLGRMRVAARIIGRPVLAWGVVQACCIALLSLLHRAHLLSTLWFTYWTLTTGVALVLFRACAFAAFDALERVGRRMRLGVGDARARRRANLGKRAFDVSVAALLLVALAPLFAFVALAVKADGGPALYGHERVGRYGRRFRCLKFRTMVPDADAVLKAVLERDPDARAEWAREFKLKRDVRVTAIGRFLRRSSLDELPQLFNVMRGDMSLVGPRPIVASELPRYGADAVYYLASRPGITGLWQVSGRNDVGYAARVALDVAYVRTRSMRRDLVILLKTVKVVLRGSGAY